MIFGIKNNKSAGPDNIPADYLKAGLSTFVRALQPIILLLKLLKRGGLTQYDNWHKITLLNVANKILTQILHKGLPTILEQCLTVQESFTKARQSS